MQTFGPFEPLPPLTPLSPGVLYREAGPFTGQVRLFAIDGNGGRCFEVTICARSLTPALLARWADDAREIGHPGLSLIR